MMHEYDLVTLTVPIPAYDLQVGERGVIVDMRPDLDTYIVEFMRGEETVAVTAVTSRQIRVVEAAQEQAAGVAD